MNVLCLGARVIGPELMIDLVRAFVAAPSPEKNAIAVGWAK